MPPKIAGSGGSMVIRGSLDTSLIDRGFRIIKQGFNKVKSSVKSFGSDMIRISHTVSRLVKKLALLGSIGLGAIIGLASRAPAVAGSIAKIKVSFDKLTRILGEALGPAFEKASELFEKFVGWVGANKDTITAFANTVVSAAEAIGKFATEYLSKFNKEAKETQKYLGSGGAEGTPEVNIPGKLGIAGGVGVATAVATRSPLAGAAAGAMTYGAIDQLERTMEFQTRLASGEGGLGAAGRSYAPGVIGDLYGWLFDKIGGASREESRKQQSLAYSSQYWG